MSRILVIEDDDAVRETIASALTEAGHHVITVANGTEALEYLIPLGSHQPDGILLDLYLPQVDGRDFAYSYRKLPVPHAPFIVVTAARDGAARAAEIGAQAIVAKPFDVRDLVDTVAREMARGHIAGAA